MNFTRRAGLRRIRLGVLDDVVFMIASNQQPALTGGFFQYEFQAFCGLWSAIDQIAVDDYVVWFPVIQIRRGGEQSWQICVNIGKHGEFHCKFYFT